MAKEKYGNLKGTNPNRITIRDKRSSLRAPYGAFSDKFNKYVSENNMEQAYYVFETCRQVLLIYYNHNGQEKTKEFFEESKKQIGKLKTLNMKLTLPSLIKKEEKSGKNLIKELKK